MRTNLIERAAMLSNMIFSQSFDSKRNLITVMNYRRGNVILQYDYATNALNQYALVDDFVPAYDADGNATLVQTSTGTWSISYNHVPVEV